jgi:hypothetical protein
MAGNDHGDVLLKIKIENRNQYNGEPGLRQEKSQDAAVELFSLIAHI